eukprot:CAMPEP_0194490632 /NCGR_PEP_ID=MMETSP0253-20130528/9782_1 /TAXON_ID=2966 /ORGANISM="Noctiluca scintillans" /LENGTH=220 /DNA_ID=CAMNT_0039331279 /DNA_START=369 /DNA_END=1031 /DNA_ORIENTATION=+
MSRTSLTISCQGVNNLKAFIWVSMLDDALHHIVPEPVSNQRLNLVQHLRDKRQELYPGTVFQEALHDAASEAVPGNTCSVASEFLNHERYGIRRQQFDAFLQHVVRVGRTDGVMNVATKSGGQRDPVGTRRCLQHALHLTTSCTGPTQTPDVRHRALRVEILALRSLPETVPSPYLFQLSKGPLYDPGFFVDMAALLCDSALAACHTDQQVPTGLHISHL